MKWCNDHHTQTYCDCIKQQDELELPNKQRFGLLRWLWEIWGQWRKD